MNKSAFLCLLLIFPNACRPPSPLRNRLERKRKPRPEFPRFLPQKPSRDKGSVRISSSSFDDHSYEAVSAYGGRPSKVAPTPNLDRIAKEGIRFDNCFVTTALCYQAGRSFRPASIPTSMGSWKTSTDSTGASRLFPSSCKRRLSNCGHWKVAREPIRRVMISERLPGQGTYYAPDFRLPKALLRERRANTSGGGGEQIH